MTTRGHPVLHYVTVVGSSTKLGASLSIVVVILVMVALVFRIIRMIRVVAVVVVVVVVVRT